jgi:isoleucyl-tRNA synthetase
MAEQDNQKKSFKDTLNLPYTNFPIRPNPKEDDLFILKRWENENLYKRSFEKNKGEEKFILHDGPPYANGHIHIGHAYNKILKDIVCKSQRMLGKHVPVTPGWDCHGLPIEFAVKKENSELTGDSLKKACREYAQKWIAIQKYEFKQLGVLMDWDNPYLTMDFKYEADTLNAFGILVEKGYIERKNKTVPWCPSCQTVLASAEIEYQDRKDPSLYVLFELEQNASKQLFPQLTDKKISLLVWTTTPWTLPLNRAVLLKPNADYAVLETENNYIVIGKSRADAIVQLLDIQKNIVAECNAQDLVSLQPRVAHPFIDGFFTPVLVDDSVLTDDGTACVHSAPGVGPIDYEVGIKNNLEIYSPISPDGRYTQDINIPELVGMSVTQAHGWVIQKLTDANLLLLKTSIKHSYPHCWRCRGGLIFRATKQWFCDLSRNDLKEKACESISRITMLPAVSHNRFEATIEGRLEWCLSRQRVWGIPIPALICDSCDYTYINKEFINEIAQKVAQEGIEYWDNVSLESLTCTKPNLSSIAPNSPQEALNKLLQQVPLITCPQCSVGCLRKETDILDVWFDSGISHYAVLKQNPALQYPADMYLEGKDQHRGWFQSSLLTSMIIEQTPCTKTIVTHGFTVDEQGRKMSKSLGNVVAPQEIIDRLGTDGLRLWASSVDNSGDAVVSEVLFKNVQEVFRKIRNTCRFLLSNINDFDMTKDAIAVEKMNSIDQYAMQELFELYEEVMHAYTDYNFTRVFHLFGNYCAVNLSAFYLDIVKDRLYVEKKDGLERRSAQTVCLHILDTLTKLMAPILSFTAEQISDEYQKDKTDSIHLQQFPVVQNIWEQLAHRSSLQDPQPIFHKFSPSIMYKTEEIALRHDQEDCWEILKNMRSALLKAIELQREKQIVKHSLEAQVALYINPAVEFAAKINNFFRQMNEKGEATESFLKEFLIVSQCTVQSNSDNLAETELKGLFARVEHAQGVKCPRCWQWDATNDPDGLCNRCVKIVT